MTLPLTAAKDLLAKLVAFDTTSHKTNIPLIEFVQGYLADHGTESQLVPTPDGLKASLFATIGPKGVPGVGLSGHTDVVPVTGQDWATDPFTLVERSGLLYGRGTADMKGFLAAVLAMVPAFKSLELKTPIHIIFSYDEEVGCIGVRPLVAELGKSLTMPKAVIVGEPTTMQVVDAHKGPMRWVVDIQGRASHSSMPQLGVNAIAAATRMMSEILEIEAELKRDVNPRFDPPYSTMAITTINGGTASNITPAPCTFGFETRRLPGFDVGPVDARIRKLAAKLEAEMREHAPEAHITFTTREVPAFVASASGLALPLALQLAGQNETFAVSYATEAGLFQDQGAPSVVCGPGNIDQAHKPDEFIAVSELEKCLGFLQRLGAWAEAN
ncbi:MAG: acetylornithine deacetylase [Hyphomicrobiales bacterium]|nr:MAG: acetylornithine deacetylase [Hyphomicrobiales bacterium]